MVDAAGVVPATPTLPRDDGIDGEVVIVLGGEVTDVGLDGEVVSSEPAGTADGVPAGSADDGVPATVDDGVPAIGGRGEIAPVPDGAPPAGLAKVNRDVDAVVEIDGCVTPVD